MLPHKNKKTGFWLRKARSYPYIVIFKPLKISSLVVEYLPRTWFFYMIFWYFFLLLLWSSIWHQLFLLLATFVFGPMEKSTTCVTLGIRDFGHWSWKVSHDAHNLQPFDGLIKKKQKRWPFPIWAQLCGWLYISIELTFLKELILIKQVHQKSVIFVNIGIS